MRYGCPIKRVQVLVRTEAPVRASYKRWRFRAAFYQESGRCGRDGRAARSVLYYSPSDAALLQFVLQQQYEEQLTRSLAKMNAEHAGQQNFQQLQQKIQKDLKTKHDRDVEKLNAVIQFCTSCSCRRKVLLQHFGEQFRPSRTKSDSTERGDLFACCDICEQRETTCKQRLDHRGPQRNERLCKGRFDGLSQTNVSPLEMEHQRESDSDAERHAEQKFGGKVVYHSCKRTGAASALVSTGVRKKGLSAVLKELERLEELEETKGAHTSNGPTLFARFRSNGASSDVQVSSTSVNQKKWVLRKSPGLQKPLKAVGDVVGVPTMRPLGGPL